MDPTASLVTNLKLLFIKEESAIPYIMQEAIAAYPAQAFINDCVDGASVFKQYVYEVAGLPYVNDAYDVGVTIITSTLY